MASEIFDKYLGDEMHPQELQKFKEQLQNEPELLKTFNEYKQIKDVLDRERLVAQITKSNMEADSIRQHEKLYQLTIFGVLLLFLGGAFWGWKTIFSKNKAEQPQEQAQEQSHQQIAQLKAEYARHQAELNDANQRMRALETKGKRETIEKLREHYKENLQKQNKTEEPIAQAHVSPKVNQNQGGEIVFRSSSEKESANFLRPYNFKLFINPAVQLINQQNEFVKEIVELLNENKTEAAFNLIQSLPPSDEKTLLSANVYLSKGDYTQARRVFNRLYDDENLYKVAAQWGLAWVAKLTNKDNIAKIHFQEVAKSGDGFFIENAKELLK